MTESPEPKSERLRDLYWREEILQVVFWIEGEGFGEQIRGRQLERFLGLDPTAAQRHLEKLASTGHLRRMGDGYALTPEGRAEGARAFSDEFADLTRPAHGECGPECWCHASIAEAEACAAERIQASHP